VRRISVRLTLLCRMLCIEKYIRAFMVCKPILPFIYRAGPACSCCQKEYVAFFCRSSVENRCSILSLWRKLTIELKSVFLGSGRGGGGSDSDKYIYGKDRATTTLIRTYICMDVCTHLCTYSFIRMGTGRNLALYKFWVR